ncbi:hypothetical protein AK812_SmicGene5744 [Symbiodinium microadriaticum]|uniref:Uncharacterized protein n=1 Tax=Symbiodinium microadriaticum TaxID=2951 RepID=A0A1Q9ET03_SYMMI|nr:hypothetical protein AK812_SmicGene5744 [Symbiodinium microadriaticum]
MNSLCKPRHHCVLRQRGEGGTCKQMVLVARFKNQKLQLRRRSQYAKVRQFRDRQKVRDLQDQSLDAEAEVEEATARRPAQGISKPSKFSGPKGDTAKAMASGFELVPRFNPDRDMNEQDEMLKNHNCCCRLRCTFLVSPFTFEQEAAELRASKAPEAQILSAASAVKEAVTACRIQRRLLAKQLAERNYRLTSLPPCELSEAYRDAQAEANYFDRYFNGRPPTRDRPPPTLSTMDGAPEDLVDPRRAKPKPTARPDAPTVAFMNSRELKYAMVNEAYLVRKWRNDQPEAGAAELWMAFGYRAAELSCGRSVRPLPGEDAECALTPGTGTGRVPRNRCSLSTTLRFLQAMASVQVQKRRYHMLDFRVL